MGAQDAAVRVALLLAGLAAPIRALPIQGGVEEVASLHPSAASWPNGSADMVDELVAVSRDAEKNAFCAGDK